MCVSIPAIVLAAGASSRLGQPKQLIEFEGETLLVRTIRMAREAGADPVFAVLGAQFELMIVDAQGAGAIPHINFEWEQGMSTSIHTGLRGVSAAVPKAPGVLLLTCDQPRLTAAHLTDLLGAFQQEQKPLIVASAYEGTLGTPAIIPRALFSKLNALQGDKGARVLFANPACPILERPFPGGAIDIDTPDDLTRLRD